MKKLALICLIFFAWPSSRAQASLPQAKVFMTQLLELAKNSRDSAGKGDAATKGRIREVSAKIDFTALAKRSIGPRWAKFPESERQDFLKTLQEILEVVVYPNAKKIATAPENLEYADAPHGRVKVTGKVQREKNGEIVNQTLEVVLVFDPKTDKIVDAVIEDEVLSASLKRQFTEALKKQSFAMIIEKMKKRVNEERAQGGA